MQFEKKKLVHELKTTTRIYGAKLMHNTVVAWLDLILKLNQTSMKRYLRREKL